MRMNRRLICLLVFCGLLLLTGPIVEAGEESHTPLQKNFEDTSAYKVVRIVDGDTVVLLMDGKETKVRLIGVDTPETVHPAKPVELYGKEASRFTRNLLLGEHVYLEYEPGPSKVDKYGRVLAYLYRAPDGLFVNLEIIRQGYGHAYVRYPFQYMELFRSYERVARESGKGLWAVDSPEQSSHQHSSTVESENAGKTDAVETKDDGTLVYVTRSGKKYHREQCRFLSKTKIPMPLDEARRKYSPCSICNPPP